MHVDKEESTFKLKIGDILFQDLDSSPICDAIELVTPGFQNANLSHIGIVAEIGHNYFLNPKENSQDKIKVIEAIPGGVTTTNLDSFLLRSLDNNGNPKVIVGRVKDKYKHTIPKAIKFSKKQIGVEYDEIFLLDNNKYYCSELIYESFLQDSIFTLQPMTFLHPETNDTLQAWIEYYNKLKSEIPQNELGINPGVMSLSSNIEIVHYFGMPDGMKE